MNRDQTEQVRREDAEIKGKASLAEQNPATFAHLYCGNVSPRVHNMAYPTTH